MTHDPASHDELRDLLSRRPMNLTLFFKRYLMGNATELAFTPDELRDEIDWKDDETDINDLRLEIIQDELKFTMDGLREQFAKVASIIALFALLIAFGLNGPAKERTVAVVCVAVIIAVWVQSPRLKIFQFRRRADSGVRIGAITTQFDRYYYYYTWLNRREQTLHVAEVLVFAVTMTAVVALTYVAVAA